MDVSLEAADRLIAAARGAGVRMTVISQHRFDPGPAELRRLLDEQLATLTAESVAHLELRSAWSVGVADLSDADVGRIGSALSVAGVRVSAIGSPIGKIPAAAPLGPELERLRRVAEIAGRLGTPIIRVFSFFLPAGEPPGRYREQVIDRMGALAAVARSRVRSWPTRTRRRSTAMSRSGAPT
jgi:hypothetical protein